MKLREYLDEKGIKAKKFAEELGVSSSQFSQWVTNKKMPRIETIQKIEKLTGGKVKAKDWITE